LAWGRVGSDCLVGELEVVAVIVMVEVWWLGCGVGSSRSPSGSGIAQGEGGGGLNIRGWWTAEAPPVGLVCVHV
jgi:hypothetical protein